MTSAQNPRNRSRRFEEISRKKIIAPRSSLPYETSREKRNLSFRFLSFSNRFARITRETSVRGRENERGLDEQTIGKFNHTCRPTILYHPNQQFHFYPITSFLFYSGYFHDTRGGGGGNFRQFHRARILILAKLRLWSTSWPRYTQAGHRSTLIRGRGTRQSFVGGERAAYKAAEKEKRAEEGRGRVGQEITSPDVRSFGFRAPCNTALGSFAVEKRHRGGKEEVDRILTAFIANTNDISRLFNRTRSILAV